MSPEQTFARLDKVRDGTLTLSEFAAHHPAPPTAKPSSTTTQPHKVQVE